MIRSWFAALVLAFGLVTAPPPASAQTETQLQELVAWAAPLTDIQTRMQAAVRSVTAVSRAARQAQTTEGMVAVLRAGQPTIRAARAELRALRAELDALPPFASPNVDERVVRLTDLALSETRNTIDLFDGAIADVEQLLPAFERNDVEELTRLANRLVMFTANFMRSQANTLRVAQLQLPAEDPLHHINGARAEMMGSFYAILTISTPTDASAVTAATARARVWVASGRAALREERARYLSLGDTRITALQDINERQLDALDAFIIDVDVAAVRLTPQTPLPRLIELLRALGEHDRVLQQLSAEGGALAAQVGRR